MLENYDLVVTALSKAKRGTANIDVKANYFYCAPTNFDYVKVGTNHDLKPKTSVTKFPQNLKDIFPDERDCDITLRQFCHTPSPVYHVREC